MHCAGVPAAGPGRIVLEYNLVSNEQGSVRLLLSSNSLRIRRVQDEEPRDLFRDSIGGWHQWTTEMATTLRDAT